MVSLSPLFCTIFLLLISSSDAILRLPLLYKPPSHPREALALDAHRLFTVFSGRTAVKSPVVSGASTGSGQYFVNLRLGTPPQSFLLVADTGSDLIWVKCSACKNCTHRTAFTLYKSSTFSLHHCYQKPCHLVLHPKPNPCSHTRFHTPCRYEYAYADGSTTAGFFSRETATLRTSHGKETRLKNLSFGCGFRISGPSVTGASFNGANGVMGLGRGPISFPSQLGRRYGNRFSYCLPDYTLSPPPTSYLTIGESQNDTVGSRLSHTPLQFNPFSPSFYYIGIKYISVNGVKLRINPSVWGIDKNGNGGTVIDSGTTLSFLAEPAYRRVLATMRRLTKLPSPAKSTPGFDLCVNVSGVARPRFPKLSFRLVGGAVFKPPSRNYFLETAAGVKCLAIQPVLGSGSSSGGFSVIGNLMQQGFLLAFDNDRSRLGFSRRGCGLP